MQYIVKELACSMWVIGVQAKTHHDFSNTSIIKGMSPETAENSFSISIKLKIT